MDKPIKYVIGRNGRLYFRTNRYESLVSIIPETRLETDEPDEPGGKPLISVPYTQEVCEVLADLSIDHLPYMIPNYEWVASFEPMAHQYSIAGNASTHKKFFILADPGTGKTISVVWAVHYLLRMQRVKRALIISPKSLIWDVWEAEFKNGASDVQVVCAHHADAKKRKAILTKPHHVAVINYDGVESVIKTLDALSYDMLIVDEGTALKNINRRWRYINKLRKKVNWCWWMTGTPTAQSPEDAYGQCKMMHQEAFPYTQTSWRDATMIQVSRFKWIPKPTAIDLVRYWMRPAIYINKRDVLPFLPPVMRARRRVDLSEKQKQAMQTLRKHAAALVDGANLVSAVHSAALRVKLLQIASGTVYSDEGQVVELDATPRLKELTHLVKEARAAEDKTCPHPNNKVIVCCAFKHTTVLVSAHLRAKGFNVDVVHGGVSQKHRDAIFTKFKTDWTMDAIVVVPDVMAHGLTLTTAATIIWYTPISSSELFIQTSNRINRPGQKHPMRILELYATEEERAQYDSLAGKAVDLVNLLAGYTSQIG